MAEAQIGTGIYIEENNLQFLIDTVTLSEECSMKFQGIALMIQHTSKSLETIKSPTACFTVKIIRKELPKSKINIT